MNIYKMRSHAEWRNRAEALQAEGFVFAAQAVRYFLHHGDWPDMGRMSLARLMELQLPK